MIPSELQPDHNSNSVPEKAEPVDPGTVICTTFNAANDDDDDKDS